MKKAKGIKGFIYQDFDGDLFFRVYDKNSIDGFIDYHILVNEIEVEINDEFIILDDLRKILSDSPEILGEE